MSKIKGNYLVWKVGGITYNFFALSCFPFWCNTTHLAFLIKLDLEFLKLKIMQVQTKCIFDSQKQKTNFTLKSKNTLAKVEVHRISKRKDWQALLSVKGQGLWFTRAVTIYELYWASIFSLGVQYSICAPSKVQKNPIKPIIQPILILVFWKKKVKLFQPEFQFKKVVHICSTQIIFVNMLTTSSH